MDETEVIQYTAVIALLHREIWYMGNELGWERPEASTESQDSAVSMENRLRPGHPGAHIPVGSRKSRPTVTHPALGSLPKVKGPECEPDQQ
jgi:hypothetical protein